MDRFVDRHQSEDRGDEELMIRRLSAPANSDGMQDYEWEPALTLSHTIQRGLEYPRRSFSVYLKAKQPNINQAILSFTTDDQLILGLAIDDVGERPKNLEHAKELLSLIAENYGCHRGLILVEQPPPNSEKEFEQSAQDPYRFCLFSSVW